MHIATDADADTSLQSRLTEPAINKRAFFVAYGNIQSSNIPPMWAVP
jgi:hypothetical protein